MKTLKKVGWESKLSHRPFFMFSPDAEASGRRWNTAQPVGGSAAANSQCNCLFSQTRLCLYGSVTLHSLCFHLLIRPSGKLFVRQFHYIRKWVKGQCTLQRDIVCAISPPLPLPGPGAMPLVGCRGETPHRFLKLQREIACLTIPLHPQLGQGPMALVGWRGEALRISSCISRR